MWTREEAGLPIKHFRRGPALVGLEAGVGTGPGPGSGWSVFPCRGNGGKKQQQQQPQCECGCGFVLNRRLRAASDCSRATMWETSNGGVVDRGGGGLGSVP